MCADTDTDSDSDTDSDAVLPQKKQKTRTETERRKREAKKKEPKKKRRAKGERKRKEKKKKKIYRSRSLCSCSEQSAPSETLPLLSTGFPQIGSEDGGSRADSAAVFCMDDGSRCRAGAEQVQEQVRSRCRSRETKIKKLAFEQQTILREIIKTSCNLPGNMIS